MKKFFEKRWKRGLTLWGDPWYIEAKQGRNGSPPNTRAAGGGTMTISEILALLTLLAVVIFGIIDIMKKKWPPPYKGSGQSSPSNCGWAVTVAVGRRPCPTWYHKRGLKSIPDPKSKTAWERENVIKLTIKVNRNQDPELYELFTRESGSKGSLAKSLMNQALKQNHTK